MANLADARKVIKRIRISILVNMPGIVIFKALNTSADIIKNRKNIFKVLIRKSRKFKMYADKAIDDIKKAYIITKNPNGFDDFFVMDQSSKL